MSDLKQPASDGIRVVPSTATDGVGEKMLQECPYTACDGKKLTTLTAELKKEIGAKSRLKVKYNAELAQRMDLEDGLKKINDECQRKCDECCRHNIRTVPDAVCERTCVHYKYKKIATETLERVKG